MKGTILFKHKNSMLSMAGSLQADPVYSSEENVIPYFKSENADSAVYVNQIPGLSIGTSLTINVNGLSLGTVKTRDIKGTYFIFFNPPYGTFDIETVTPAGAKYRQSFRSSKLHLLLYAYAQTWFDNFISNMYNYGGNFLSKMFGTTNYPGISDGIQAYDNWGSLIGFVKPPDWTYEQYVQCLGGNITTDAPGVFSALLKGCTTGAIKDIVTAVTGYTPTDADFRGLIGNNWITPYSSPRYRITSWTGVTPNVADTDPAPHKANRLYPHCFISKSGVPSYSPVYPDAGLDQIAIAGGAKLKAFTLQLSIKSNGFTVTSEAVTKSEDNADDLEHSKLYLWTDNSTNMVSETLTSTGADITLTSTPASNAALHLFSDAGLRLTEGIDYTLSGATLNIPVSGTYYALYRTAAVPSCYVNSVTASASASYIVITASNRFPIANAQVWINGKYVSQDLCSRTENESVYQIRVTTAISSGDVIVLAYHTEAAPYAYEWNTSPVAATITLPEPLCSTTMNVYVNGEHLIKDVDFTSDGNSITFINFSLLASTDVITITGDRKEIVGGNVSISWLEYYSGGVTATRTATQGIDYLVDYDAGQILWQTNTGVTKPTDGTSYTCSYRYFPFEILDLLFRLVKPAHIRILQKYIATTADGYRTFSSWTWDGVNLPQGIIV